MITWIVDRNIWQIGKSAIFNTGTDSARFDQHTEEVVPDSGAIAIESKWQSAYDQSGGVLVQGDP